MARRIRKYWAPRLAQEPPESRAAQTEGIAGVTDRELLELAAKAAGYVNAKWQNMEGWGELRHGMSNGIWTGDEYWNPLINDGDALRLLAALRMDVLFYPSDEVEVIATHHGVTDQLHPYAMEPAQAETAAATRRAIVRAAAAIGAAK